MSFPAVESFQNRFCLVPLLLLFTAMARSSLRRPTHDDNHHWAGPAAFDVDEDGPPESDPGVAENELLLWYRARRNSIRRPSADRSGHPLTHRCRWKMVVWQLLLPKRSACVNIENCKHFMTHNQLLDNSCRPAIIINALIISKLTNFLKGGYPCGKHIS